jgi:hypothetical protein
VRTWADLKTPWAVLGNPWRSIFNDPVPENTSDFSVQLGLQRAFILDDDTAGVIGNSIYVLSGEEFVDITPYAYTIASSRGKNQELDKYRAGSINIQLHNQSRFFDPDFVESPYVGNLVPRRGLRVLVGSVPVFTGRVADWNLGYSPGKDATATVEGIDNFRLLAQQRLTAGTVVEETTGERIAEVLDMSSVDWPADNRLIDTGQSTLGSAVLDGTENALAYLQEVELSEIGGSLFVSREGYLTFKDRLATPQTDGAILFSDDGTGIPFTAIEVEYGTENLYNRVTVTSEAGTAIANDTNSQQQFGLTEESFDTFLSSQEQLDAAATFLLERFSQPQLRVDTLTVDMNAITQAQRNAILELELADIGEVKWTPNGVGEQVDKGQLIIGINHAITLDSHRVQLKFAPVSLNNFIIGDAEFGTIGEDAQGVLAF